MTLILSGTNGLSDVDGSAATPAVRGTDANTGIFFPAADTIGFAEGGAEVMRIDSSGNVLVGTANTPSNRDTVTPKLVVNGAGVAGSMQVVRNTTPGNGGAILELTATRGTDANSYTILQSGDGIGSVIFGGADGTQFTPAATIFAGVDGTPGANDMPGRLIFSTTADGAATVTERMRIDSSGNVGIGTTSLDILDQVGASRPLVVKRSDSSTTINGSTASISIVNSDTTTSNTAQLNFAAITGANTSGYSSGVISCIFGARTNGQYPTGILTFSTSSTLNAAPSEKMRIDSSGNLLFNSGYGSVATAYGCRAWVNFNGTGTVAIRASANVTSITDNNTGRYTVNFTTAMPDANYSTVGTCNFEVDVGIPVNTNSNATGSVQVTSYRPSPYNVYVDVSTMSVAVFR